MEIQKKDMTPDELTFQSLNQSHILLTSTFYQCTFMYKAPEGYFLLYNEDFITGVKDKNYLKPPKWCPIFCKNCIECEFFTHIENEIKVWWKP